MSDSPNGINAPDNVRAALLFVLSIGILVTVGCGGGSSSQAPSNDNPGNEMPAPDPDPAPNPAPDPDPDPPTDPDAPVAAECCDSLRTEGAYWVGEAGVPLVLMGTNIGNWLLHEFWMMNQSANTVATDQCRLEATLDDRFGFAERERLLDLFRDNWIGERDWDIMASFGLNVIRLPFVWNVIEDENNPMSLRADAWQYIDYAIDEAEAHGMYVILDLHGAVGAQGFPDHSGCADRNLYWSTPEFQERTTWLWQQIAERYRDRDAVAAYGLLNEPWGTDAENMAAVMIDLYHAVRAVDPDKIVVLPGHFSGIDAYGAPQEFGGNNVAFDMHFYPGFFGWGEPNYDTHRDWINCGDNGESGVCEWDARMQLLESPLLVGEFQPWANLGPEFGAQNSRAAYDRYAELGWAATSWSYKVLTGSGGQGQGTWGMVTNKREGLGLVTKADTWACAGWDSTFANACAVPADTISPATAGAQTYYLVIKFGACCDGVLDSSVDNISLLDDLGAENVVNGGFGSMDGWTVWTASGAPTLDFNYTNASGLPSGAEGAALRMTGATSAGIPEINGGVYQAITLEGGRDYTLSGVFKDNGSANSWAEIYIVEEQPANGVDVLGSDALPVVAFDTAPIEEIESVFQLYGTVEYEVHQELFAALTATEPSSLYVLPDPPTGLAVMIDGNSITLSWNASISEGVAGYNVYRSVGNNQNYLLIAENLDALGYVDTDVQDETYFYQVAAVDAEDVGFPGEEVASGGVALAVPGLIQAEAFTRMEGFQLEDSGDTGGTKNTGFADLGDYLEYDVNIAAAGNYLVEYRLASLNGSEGFTMNVAGSTVDTVTLEATGGWQTYITLENTVTLPAGNQTIRLDSVGGEWNLNWMRFTTAE